MDDEISKAEIDAQEAIIRQDFGYIEEEELTVKDKLTPIDKVDASFVISKASYSIFGRNEKPEPPTRDQSSLALLALQIYQNIQSKIRDDTKKENADFKEKWGRSIPMLDRHEHYGESTELVDYVTVTPVGPTGRYLVGFTTTHVEGPEDTQTRGSGVFFDEQALNLGENYPNRDQNHWLAGKKDGKYILIGKYHDLHEEAEGLMERMLQRKGYTDIAELSPCILDNHSGWLKETPAK